MLRASLFYEKRSWLKELDLDGGQLTGGIPYWLPQCFPRLAELDLSFNRLEYVLLHYRCDLAPYCTFTAPDSNLSQHVKML